MKAEPLWSDPGGVALANIGSLIGYRVQILFPLDPHGCDDDMWVKEDVG